jgi:hypothetical protein
MREPIHDLDVVALLQDLPEHGLPAGQTGTVLLTHNNGEAFEVEFILRPHKSVVATVRGEQLLKLKGTDYPAAAV